MKTQGDEFINKINEVIEKLLDTNRADLSATLFGGDL